MIAGASEERNTVSDRRAFPESLALALRLRQSVGKSFVLLSRELGEAFVDNRLFCKMR